VPAPPPRALTAYWHDVRDSTPVSREEEAELVRRARGGDDAALQALVVANLRFVVQVANEFRGTGAPLHELISDGNLGLMEAARRFDETLGFRFISYAVWWIRQTIRRSLRQRRRQVSAPSNRLDDMKIVEDTRSRLTHRLGRTPTDREVADETGFTTLRVRRALEVSAPEVPLDALHAPEEFVDGIGLEQSPAEPADLDVELGEERDIVGRCLGILDERQREILRRHYGFDGEPMTLEAIGQRMGLTRERIRQLRNEALGRIRDRFGTVLHEISVN
jgi:RNA polymerase primary sigma factor